MSSKVTSETSLIGLNSLDRHKAKKNTDMLMLSKHIQATKETLKWQASKYTPTWLINDTFLIAL